MNGYVTYFSFYSKTVNKATIIFLSLNLHGIFPLEEQTIQTLGHAVKCDAGK